MKSFNIQITENKNTTEIILSGNLNVSNSEAIHKKIQNLMKKPKNLRINISDVESIDLSMVQVLYSAQKSLLHEGKELTVKPNLPFDLSLLMEKTGLKNIFN